MVMAATYLQKKYKFEANLGILQLFYDKRIFVEIFKPRKSETNVATFSSSSTTGAL